MNASSVFAGNQGNTGKTTSTAGLISTKYSDASVDLINSARYNVNKIANQINNNFRSCGGLLHNQMANNNNNNNNTIADVTTSSTTNAGISNCIPSTTATIATPPTVTSAAAPPSPLLLCSPKLRPSGTVKPALSTTSRHHSAALNKLRKLKILPHQSKIIGDSESYSIDSDQVTNQRPTTIDSTRERIGLNENSLEEHKKTSIALTPPIPTPSEADTDDLGPIYQSPNKTKGQSPISTTIRYPPQPSNSIEIRICKSSVVNDETSHIVPLNIDSFNFSPDINSCPHKREKSNQNHEKRPPLTRMANSSRTSSPSESENDTGGLEHATGHRNSGDYMPVSQRGGGGGSTATGGNRANQQSFPNSTGHGKDIHNEDQQARINLMGQPMNTKHKKMSSRFQLFQSKIYNFLERPKGKFAITYHSLMFLLVFLCLLLSVMSTVQDYSEISLAVLLRLEVFLVIGYSMEYGLRVWSAGCRSRYQDIPGRLRFMKQPFNLLDLVICGLSFFLLTMRQGKGNTFAPYALRGLKFLQILRIVRMDRRAGTWKLLGSVVYLHRQELITTFYIGFLGLIFASFVVYQAEKGQNEQFSNYADALWWGIVTLTTVGYGDATPKTWPGKLTASFFAIMGISFFALPAGILGSGFALKVQQQQRQKHVARRRQPAASLIQCLWRCYAANEDSLSVATWLIHVKPKNSKDSSGSNHCNRPKKQSSFLNRIQTSRQRKSNPNHNQLDSLTSDNLRSAVGPFGGNAPSRQGSIRKTHPQYSGGSNSGRTHFEPSLAHQHSHQYTGSHTNLKESLKISDSKRSSRQGSIFSLQFDSFPNPFSSNPNSRRNSAESEQDEESQMLTKLRPCHKVAIRFVRKLKYFVYRRKFREALKPYDVKDVIEQYAAGHVELLSRVKEIQQRIDIVVGSKDKKKQAETKMTVASRIVKLESQITYLERKLDHLINVYRKDQMRYKRTDTTNSNHDDDDHPQSSNVAGASSTVAASTVAANQLLAPFYKRDDAKSTMSMNLLSPDQPHDSSKTHSRYKNRSSSQPTSLENLRNLPETTPSTQNNRGGSLMSSQKKHSLLPLRTTSIKIPSFLERNSQKSQ